MARMLPVPLGLALLCTLVPPALAKDVCIQVDAGWNPGSQIVLKRVNLGAQKFAPVHGYYVRYDPSTSAGFIQWNPLDGQAIVASNRNLILGLTLHEIAITNTAAILTHSRMFPINLGCEPGTDGKIGVLDACTGWFGGSTSPVDIEGHIIDCDDALPIP